MLAPPGLMVPSPGSYHTPAFLTPVLSSRAKLGVLKGNGRNCVHTVKFKGLTFTRVMPIVYSPDGSELPNHWRVTNYTSHGHVIVSASCYFTYEFGDKELNPIQRRKKFADKIICSSQSTNYLRLWCFLAQGTGAVSSWEDSASGRRTRWNILTSESCSLHVAGLVTLWLAWSMLPTSVKSNKELVQGAYRHPKVTLLRFFRTSTPLYTFYIYYIHLYIFCYHSILRASKPKSEWHRCPLSNPRLSLCSVVVLEDKQKQKLVVSEW